MPRGLLSRIADPNRPRDDQRSIVAHLRLMLNTRRGSALASPEYGLSDLGDMVHAFPEALPTLKRRIRDAITQSEPRLRNVSVRQVQGEDPLVFQFEVTARLAKSPRSPRLRLRTHVSSSGVEIE